MQDGGRPGTHVALPTPQVQRPAKPLMQLSLQFALSIGSRIGGHLALFPDNALCSSSTIAFSFCTSGSDLPKAQTTLRRASAASA